MARHGSQQKLIDIPAHFQSGFVYRPDFLTTEEERTLLATIEALPLEQEFYRGEYRAKRRSFSFGWGYDFNRKRLIPGERLPRFLQPIVRKIAKWMDIPRSRIVQAHVIEYPPGAAIGWHVDREDFEHVIGISLFGWCRMGLRPLGKRDNEVVSLDLEPRSIYVLQKEVRWRFEHRIQKTKVLRYSITFRTLPALS